MMVVKPLWLFPQCLTHQYWITVKKLLTGYQLEYHPPKIKLIDTNLAPTMSNLANGKVSLKFNNNVLAQKN